MSTQRQKPIDFAAEGLCLASLSIPTAESGIIPTPVGDATELLSDHAHAQGAPARMSWARLLKRVFDIEHCPNCGGA